MVCCKCNRTDLCRGCACVKAGRSCVNCLPSKLGNCANATSNAPQVRLVLPIQPCPPLQHPTPCHLCRKIKDGSTTERSKLKVNLHGTLCRHFNEPNEGATDWWRVWCTERLLSNGMGARRMRNYIGDIQLSMRKANFVIRMFAAVAQDALDSQRYSLVQGFAESLQHASAKR